MFSRHIYSIQLAIAFLCASILSPILLIPHTFAATDPITVTAQTTTETFPTGIDFQVSVQDSTNIITNATLILSTSQPRYLQTERTVPVTTPQQILTLHWHEDTTNNNFIYAGTIINYKWQFNDNAGHLHIQSQQTLVVIDNRFAWQHLTQGLVQVNWYGQSSDFGQIVLSQSLNSVRRISANLGGTLLHSINLWVYQSANDFHGSLPPEVHEWVGGIAFPSLDEASIVADSPNADTLVRDMPHELTHLIFHQLTEQGITAPLWFDEGLAVYNQTYHEPEMTQHFKQALATHSLLRLNTISYTFPNDADAAYLAYAQSWNLVGYMYDIFGQAKMAKLIMLMGRPTGLFNEDLKQALGEDQIHLENQWHVQLNQPPVLTPADITQSKSQSSHGTIPGPIATHDMYTPLLVFVGLLLIILPVSGLSGLLVYQRRRRQRDLATPQAQQTQQIINTTPPPYTSVTTQSYGPWLPPYSQQQQSPAQLPMPFESYGDMTIPPISHIDTTRAYTDPTQYTAQQEQFPQSSTPGQEYTSQPPPKQVSQE